MKISMLCTHLFCFQLLFLSLFIHYCYAKKRVLGETNELESFGETEKQTTPRVKSITDYLLPPTPRIYPGNIMPPAMPRKGNEFLSASIKSSYILDNYYIYNQDTRTRNFQGSVMLYVTPWNKKGYEMAKIMAPKLDYLAPVWFIAKKEGKKVVVHGENDVDKDWLQAVRNAHKSSPITEDKEIHTESVDKNTCTEDTCSSTSSTADLTSSPASTPDVDSSSVPPTIKSTVIPPPSISSSSSSSPLTSTAGDNKMPKNNPLRIVPRVSLEAAFELSELPSLVSLLLSLQKKYSFDGFTLELSLNYWDISKTLPKMLKEEAAKLKSSSTSSSSSSTTSCHIVFVIPPISVPEDRTEFNKAMAQLSSHVDVFSVMTYDKNKGQAMPNSPLDWVNSTMTGLASVPSLKNKLLMGMPMYGWRGEEAMTADTMVLWMAKNEGRNVNLKWYKSAGEHIFYERNGGVAPLSSSYPTPIFVYKRLRLAERLGVGCAIWEGGQMMPMFIDLF